MSQNGEIQLESEAFGESWRAKLSPHGRLLIASLHTSALHPLLTPACPPSSPHPSPSSRFGKCPPDSLCQSPKQKGLLPIADLRGLILRCRSGLTSTPHGDAQVLPFLWVHSIHLSQQREPSEQLKVTPQPFHHGAPDTIGFGETM